MTNYRLLDDVLPQNSFIELKDFLLGPRINWSYNQFAVRFEGDHNLHNFQFTHTFYRNYAPSSDHIAVLDPLLKILNPSAILRIKANLSPRSEQRIVQGFHTDITQFKGKTAIFYVNTNDGKTIFDDGTEIESVENRLLIFDSTLTHSGTTCTNTKVRCVINFNYYEWDR